MKYVMQRENVLGKLQHCTKCCVIELNQIAECQQNITVWRPGSTFSYLDKEKIGVEKLSTQQ